MVAAHGTRTTIVVVVAVAAAAHGTRTKTSLRAVVVAMMEMAGMAITLQDLTRVAMAMVLAMMGTPLEKL